MACPIVVDRSTDVLQLLQRLLSETGYSFEFSALPAPFVRRNLQLDACADELSSTTSMMAGGRRRLERSLAYHAEKKVLACALAPPNDTGGHCFSHMSGRSDGDVTIVVNSKMCADCHSFFKCASALFSRRIICIDGCNDDDNDAGTGDTVGCVQQHHQHGGAGFRHLFAGDGTCSCGDTWR